MKQEGLHGEKKIPEGEASDDCESEIGNSLIGEKDENDEPGEEQEDRDGKKERQQIDDSENDGLAYALVKVLSDMGTNMRWVILFNYIEVSAGPSLQKRSQKGTHETEHEADEPDRVDKYHRSGGREGRLYRKTRGVTGMVSIGIRKLLGYLREEEVGGEVGVLMQGRVTDGDEGSHRRSKKANLRSRKHTTLIIVREARGRTKTRAFPALSLQFATLLRSNLTARVIYMEKIAEGSE